MWYLRHPTHPRSHIITTLHPDITTAKTAQHSQILLKIFYIFFFWFWTKRFCFCNNSNNYNNGPSMVLWCKQRNIVVLSPFMNEWSNQTHTHKICKLDQFQQAYRYLCKRIFSLLIKKMEMVRLSTGFAIDISMKKKVTHGVQPYWCHVYMAYIKWEPKFAPNPQDKPYIIHH